MYTCAVTIQASQAGDNKQVRVLIVSLGSSGRLDQRAFVNRTIDQNTDANGLLVVELPWSSIPGVGKYRVRLIDIETGEVLHDRVCTVPDEEALDYEDLPSTVSVAPDSTGNLLVREIDGTPSGVISTLIVPSGSLTVTGGTGALEFGTDVLEYLQSLPTSVPSSPNLPYWDDEVLLRSVAGGGDSLWDDSETWDDTEIWSDGSASAGSGRIYSIDVRESGDPEQLVRTLVFPDGSLSISGTVATITIGGGSGANLSVSTTSTTVVVASDSGTDATLATASGTDAGIMTAAQFTKLSGIATAATANDTDANLRARSSHTGTQAWSTITSTPTTLAGYGISDSITAAAAVAAYQPLDSDLTSIAALTTTSFGRSLLTQADAAATRATIGAGTSSFDGAYGSLSGVPSTFTPAAHNQDASTITTGTLPVARGGTGVGTIGTALQVLRVNAGATALEYAAAASGTASENSVSGAATAVLSDSMAALVWNTCTGTTVDYTLTLPAASGNANKYCAIRMAPALTRLVTVDANSTELIDGQQTRIMWSNETSILFCNGTAWTKVAGKSLPMNCQMSRTSTQNINNVTFTKVTLATIVTDNSSAMGDTTNNRINIKRPGIYTARVFLRFDHGSTFTTVAGCFKNGSEDFRAQGYGLNDSVSDTTATISCAASDYLELHAYQTTGITKDIYQVSIAPTLTVTEVISW
jgi:hypothetical protein